MPDNAPRSPLDYINHALALMGEDALTDLLPTSGATNAAAATVWSRVVETLLSKWNWRFSVRIADGSQLAEDPPEPWTHQYNLPARTIRLVSTDRPGEPYAIASADDSDGSPRLYAMRAGVVVQVVIRPLDELFPAHFIAALIPALAAELAPGVTGNLQMAQLFRAQADDALREAKLLDANQQPTNTSPCPVDPRSVRRGSIGGYGILSRI